MKLTPKVYEWFLDATRHLQDSHQVWYRESMTDAFTEGYEQGKKDGIHFTMTVIIPVCFLVVLAFLRWIMQP